MKFVVAAAAIAAMGIAAPAMAQEASAPTTTGLYGNLGWAGTDTHDSMTNSIQGRAGWRFGRYLGVEGEVSGGLNTDHYTFAPGTAGQTTVGEKQALAGAGYLVGFLPVAPRLDLLARVGYGASRYDLSPAGLPGYHVNEDGVRFGAGAQYFFDNANGVRADYTREQMDNITDPAGYFAGDHHADVGAVSFVHKF